jgi:Predicted HD superfamily hydrolase
MRTNIAGLSEIFIKERLAEYDSGHDWWHIARVRDMALHIHEAEKKGNKTVIELAALLHDIGDSKFKKQGDPEPGAVISEFLKGLDVDDDQIIEVVRINRFISFSSPEKNDKMSDEFMIVQDADRLDAIGAIGIARAFSYGGFRNNAIYIPDEISSGSSKSTIGHFNDKLLKLKDMMNTLTGRKIAEERHKILEMFLEQFYKEWNFPRTLGKPDFLSHEDGLM